MGISMYLYLFTSTAWKFICTVCSTEQQIHHQLRPSGRAKIHFTGGIFALDSVRVKMQVLFSSHRGFLTYAMYYHGGMIKLTYWDKETRS